MKKFIYEMAGGIPNGKKLKAVIPGGSSCPIMTADEIDLPMDKVPTAACEIHGGDQMQFAQRFQDFGQKAANFPNKLFQSFRKFFGGK